MNETPPNNDPVLEIAARRLHLAKGFFIWVALIYLTLTLFVVGGYMVDTLREVVRAGQSVFLFSMCTLLYSLITYGLAIQGGAAYRMRFIVLGLLVIFI